MKKIFLILAFILALTARAFSTDVTIGGTSIPNSNISNLPSDVTVSGLSVTNGSAAVACSTCLPESWVGLSGFQITISGVQYEVSYITSRSAFTLATSYAGSTGTVSATWHKYLFLRIYASKAFTPLNASYVVQFGAPGSLNWFKRVACSVINSAGTNYLYLPELSLPATTDALPSDAKYYAAFYRIDGSFVAAYDTFTNFALPPTTPTGWTTIRQYNTPSAPVPPNFEATNFYTKLEMNNILPSCSAGQGIYFATSGRPQACLTIGPTLTISGGTLNSVANAIIAEEGTPLTQRSTLNFVGSSYTAQDNGGTLMTDVVADSDLNALASNTNNGLWARTGTGTGAARSLAAPAAGFTISNNDGVSGNPTFTLANDLAALEGLSGTGFSSRTGADAWATRIFVAPAAGFTISNNDGVSGNPTFALADDLAGLEGLSSTGIAVRTATSAWTVRSLTAPAAGFTISNNDGVSGNPTFTLANDLAALEGLGSTGIAVRTATDTWAQRTITGTANQVTVTNGDGVSGNPTLSLPQDIATSSTPTFTGVIVGASGIARSGANPVNLVANSVTVARANSDGSFELLAGNGSSSFKSAVGSYFVSLSNVSTSGTGETDLFTKTLEANVLGTDGDYLSWHIVGAFSDTSSTKTIQLYFGGTSFFSVTGNTSDFQNIGWAIEVMIQRVSSTAIKCTGVFNAETATYLSGRTVKMIRSNPSGFTFSNTNIVKITGTASAGSITAEHGIMEKGDNP